MTAIRVGGVEVKLKPDDRICRHIAAGKTFEPETLELWGEIASHGVVIDVGAYSGLFSIAASLLGAKAVAIEPLPIMTRQIKYNCTKNSARVKIIEAACADYVGESEITYNPKVELTAGASLVRKKGLKLPVNVITIDSLKLQNVTAIKIDVERGEAAVLRGAQSTLLGSRPKLIVEALDQELRNKVLAEVDGLYRLEAVLDIRNLYLLPL